MILVSTSLTATSAEPHRILLINSFGREFAPFDAFAGNFRTELVRQSSQPVDVYEVSLETARFGESEDQPVVDYWRAMFAGRRLDLVVPLGGPAVRFSQRHRERLLPGTPMLLAAVDQRHVAISVLTTNDTVVGVLNDPPRIIETILTVLPGTTNVAVIIGNSPLEQFWLDTLRRELQPFTNRVAFDWFNQLSFEEMLDRCRNLPPHSAIFYAILAVDAAGVPHMEDRALSALHSAANAPIFGLYETQLGRGIVGGPLISIEELSRKTARVAARILSGESPHGLSTPPMGPGLPLFDWRELRRWDIREAALPAGSEVRFRERNFWRRYGGRIILAIAVLIAQSVVISLLLVNRSRRRRAEGSLRESSNRLQAILATAAEGIITVDDRGTIESVNAATETLFGYAAGELIGQSVNLLMPYSYCGHQDDRPAGHRQTRWPKLLGVGREVTGRRKDGSRFPIDMAVSELALADRRIFTAFVRDLTERKQAERSSREFAGRLLHAQEAERARLARELHDDITQRLARLAIDAGRAESQADGPGRSETLREMRDGLVRLSEDVHSLSYRLHPALLQDLGLADALKAECERFSRQQSIPVEVKLGQIPENLPIGIGLCVFRVTQEALRNVARHSHATAAGVMLRQLDGGLQLAVSDCGRGFDPNEQCRRPSLGLASMQERVRLLEGELEIDSSPGRGTTVVAWVPLNGTAS